MAPGKRLHLLQKYSWLSCKGHPLFAELWKKHSLASRFWWSKRPHNSHSRCRFTGRSVRDTGHGCYDRGWRLRYGERLEKKRNDPLRKVIPSRFFNLITAAITRVHIHDFNSGIKVYKREVVQHIQLYGERHRFIPMLAKWQGYSNIGEKVVQHRPRKYGSTKFGLSRFMHGFLDLVTLKFMSQYRQRPMHFFGTIGTILLASGLAINIYLAVIKIFGQAHLSNRPLLLLGVMLMVLGAQFFSIGFLGELFYKNRGHHSNPNIRDKI